MSRNRDELKKGLPKLESMLIDFLLDSGIGPKHIKGNVVLQYAPKIQELCDSITKIRQTALKEIDGSSEKPNNHFYGIGAIRNGVQEKIDWFRSRPYFDEKSDYSKGFLDALVEMRSLVNRPDFDNPEGLDEAANIGGEKEYPIIPELTDDGKDLHAHKQVAFRKGFKVGAEWQKEQMMKEAVKWLVDDDYDPPFEEGRFILGSVGIGYNGYYIPYSDLLKLPKENEK